MRYPIAAVFFLLTGTAHSHHADSLYDLKTPTTVEGAVSRVEWANPHVYLYVNSRGANGEREEWSMQLNSPRSLERNGWTNTTVKPGDAIACTGGRARSGARAMRCLFIETGRKKLKS